MYKVLFVFMSTTPDITVPTGAQRSKWAKLLSEMTVTEDWQPIMTSAPTTAYQQANRANAAISLPHDIEFGVSKAEDGSTSTLWVRKKQ